MRSILKSTTKLFLLIAVISFDFSVAQSQHSIAREWNEVLLAGIRNDYARPTVHARNLFHFSVAAYDAWAVYDETAKTYMLGDTIGDYHTEFLGIPEPADVEEERKKAISYASYRLIRHRYINSPDAFLTFAKMDSLFTVLGYDPENFSVDYVEGGGAELGNYIAQSIIQYGLEDGSWEQFDYQNLVYEPSNPRFAPALPGNAALVDPNRWQPLSLRLFIDQSGNVIPGSTPQFLSPEWGRVRPYSLTEDVLTTYNENNFDWNVYHDPGPPPYMELDSATGTSAEYQWGFALVAAWASHMDHTDGVMWDISPGALGNLDIRNYPKNFEDYPSFYNTLEGGDPSKGWELNPKTGEPYEPNIVPRGDYARVLAEFWADGPDSETPPGHWFAIFNYVADNPSLVKRYEGNGEELTDLEWDIWGYLTLGGAMHDAAISAWGIKGYYDYIRPISAIRGMAHRGHTNPELPGYSADGIPLIPNHIEVVMPGDTLAGDSSEHVYKVKIRCWRGPDYIEDPEVDIAGVGWILAENWWPYQRPSFITPPFAGYISGHSTFSRAAAEVLTLFTGSRFFPGGIGEFTAKKDSFLVFEKGPSQDITLQWATYRDASDQTSLSRIWGGIHPPADDLPGRLIGEKIGHRAFYLSRNYFYDFAVSNDEIVVPDVLTSLVTPNPVSIAQGLNVNFSASSDQVMLRILNIDGQFVMHKQVGRVSEGQDVRVPIQSIVPGTYILQLVGEGIQDVHKIQVFE